LYLKEGAIFVLKIYFEFKEMIELKKAKLNKKKSLDFKAFFLLL